MTPPRPASHPLGPPAGPEVHLWTAVLNQTLAPVAQACAATERARAAMQPAAAGSRRKLLARGVLRCLLGAYTTTDPHKVVLRTTALGKPHLLHGGPEFSVSHCDELLVVAVAAEPVGVDVQHPRPRESVAAVLWSTFSRPEQDVVRALPPAEQPAAVARAWVRKEALLKAGGTGWTVPVDAVPAMVLPLHPGRLRTDCALGRWDVIDLSVPGGSRAFAAVATRPGSVVGEPRVFHQPDPFRSGETPQPHGRTT